MTVRLYNLWRLKKILDLFRLENRLTIRLKKLINLMMWRHKKLLRLTRLKLRKLKRWVVSLNKILLLVLKLILKLMLLLKMVMTLKLRLMVRMVVILKLQLMVKTVMILKLRLMVKMAMMANLKSLMMFLLKLFRKELNYLDRLEIQQIHLLRRLLIYLLLIINLLWVLT